MTKELTQEEVIARLLDEVKRYGSQEKMAMHLGVSQTYFNYMCQGKRAPNAKVLAAIGIREVTGRRYEIAN